MMKQANLYNSGLIIVLLIVVFLRSSMGIAFSGRECSGNRINFPCLVEDGGTCHRLKQDAYSAECGSLRAGKCQFYYYGTNCEIESLVAIIKPNTPCGNFWGNVRSAKTDKC